MEVMFFLVFPLLFKVYASLQDPSMGCYGDPPDNNNNNNNNT